MKKSKLFKSILILILIGVVLVIIYFVFNIKKENIINNSESNVQVPASNEEIKEDTNIPLTNNQNVIDSNQKKFDEALSKGEQYFIKRDYTKAIEYYNEALKYKNSDIPYYRIYVVYSAQSNYTKAIEYLDKAIKIEPTSTEYWISKIDLLNSQKDSQYSVLKEVYNQGLSASMNLTRINLVTHFARISGQRGETAEAIKLWQKAIEMYPQNKDIYQAEIDRLNKK